jgi:transposase
VLAPKSCNRTSGHHLIENTFAKLKEFRAVATRYDKTDSSYTAPIYLAAAVIASR